MGRRGRSAIDVVAQPGARDREDDMNRHAGRLVAGVVAALAVVLVGCGTRGTSPQTAPRPVTNGLEEHTAAQVAQAAATALKTAASVHVRGTFFTTNRTEKFDLRYEGGSASGTFTVSGTPIRVITAGDRAYLKAGKRGWAAMGNPDTPGLPVNQWVRAGSARQTLAPFSLAALASELASEQSAHGGTGTVRPSTLAGHKVVVVTYPDGSKLYVANVATPYPLRFDDAGAVGSRTFSQYGAAFHITVPPSAGH
jgi:hypothetical protein